MSILNYIEKIKRENEGPRITAQEPRNMYAGGQLVTPSVDGSRPGYYGRRYSTEKNFGQRGAKVITIDEKDYRLNTRGPNTGKVSFKTTKDGKDITEYLTPKQLKKRLKKKISSTVIKPGQMGKIADKINNNINNWAQKWVKNNTDKYGVRNFDNFQNDMAKAWKKELAANPNKYKGSYGVGMRITNELGLPVVRGGFEIEKITFPQRPDRLGFKPELTWKKLFYKNKLKNPEFKSKVNQYLEWATANKKLNPHLLDPNNPIGEAARSKTLALEYGKKFRGFNDDVVYFMGEVLNNRALNPGGGQTGINDIFKKEFGKNADAYFKKYQGSWGRWVNNFYDVAKLAGLNETQAKALLQKQINDTQKIMKGFNVKKLPLEFMMAQDHIMGLAEAKASGDSKIAGQTLKNLVASTREQNRVLGQEGFSNRRIKLIKEFKAAPKKARQPIVNKINALADEFVPGRLKYDVRKDGSLKITNLQPETTLKAKKVAYEKIAKTFPKNIQKLIKTAQTTKGPGRFKALQILITTLGAGGVTALGFSPTEVQAAETGAAVDKSIFPDLSFKEKATGVGAGVGLDVAKNKARISKAFLKWLPITWTPGGMAATSTIINKFMSDKEPELADFAEGFKEAGLDINSEEFQSQWNSIPEDERKEMLYDWSGQVIDKRSMSEKISETAASPWTHASYAFWKSGVEAMKKALAANPGNKTLAKKWALRAIRMGIPMRVISAVNPIGWGLTGATLTGKVFKGSEPQAFYKDGENIFKGMETQVLPTMISEYQKRWVPEKQQDKFTIDYSLPESFKKIPSGITPITEYAGGGMVGIRKPGAIAPTGGPQSGGLPSLYNNGRKL